MLGRSLKVLSKWPTVAPRMANAVNVTLNKPFTVEVNEDVQDKTFNYTFSSKKLTLDQRKFYEENGYIVIKKLLPVNEIQRYVQRFKDIANGKVKVPGMVIQKDIAVAKEKMNENTVYKIQDLFLDEEMFSYCRFPDILDYVEDLCGPSITAIHTMLINKPPDSGLKTSRHPLHQDLHYFPIRPADKIVASWTALDYVNRENGCLVALPGSHKGPLLEHDYPDWEGGVNKFYHGVKGMKIPEERVYLEMEPGDTVLFHPLLIHGSGANTTKGYRKAISCHYASSTDCYYIDVKGTSQENIANEILDLARTKFGAELDDVTAIWRFRSNNVRGERYNL